MKKLICIWAVFLLAATAFAQTQQGFVKTKGRMVNGQHVPGQGLNGATVSIKGCTPVLVNSNDGSFSFPIPAKTFMVQQVQKKGYELVDADALKKSYTYSANPICLVMETPEQQTQDQLDSERKIRRTLQRQLQQREDELEALKEAHGITLEEYQKALQQLYAEQENNEKLIAEMAKQYAQMDYDQMDELNQRISDAILNGRLTEADSLLRSKGDLKSRVTEIRREQQNEAQREKEIAQEQQALAKAKEGTQKKLEDAASDCYKFYDIKQLNLEWDSAGYYIALRAELDTTNASWQWDAADYYLYLNSFNQAEVYYTRCLNVLTDANRQTDDSYQLALTKRGIARLYTYTNRLSESERLHLEALEVFRRLANDAPKVFEHDLAETLNNLGEVYKNTRRFSECEKSLLESLAIFRRMANDDPKYKYSVALALNNLSGLYVQQQRYAEAETLLLEALDTCRRMESTPPLVYQDFVKSSVLNDLGYLYYNTNRHLESESMYLEALAILRRISGYNPKTYEPDLATTLNNLAILYERNERFPESEGLYKESLEILRRLADAAPQTYEPNLATTLWNLAHLYDKTDYLAESDKLYWEALDVYLRLAEGNPQAFHADLVKTLYCLGVVEMKENQFETAAGLFEGILSLDSTQTGVNSDWAAALLFQGEFDMAEAIYSQYKEELKDVFLQELDLYEALDIIPESRKADVEKIRKMLSE